MSQQLIKEAFDILINDTVDINTDDDKQNHMHNLDILRIAVQKAVKTGKFEIITNKENEND